MTVRERSLVFLASKFTKDRKVYKEGESLQNMDYR